MEINKIKNNIIKSYHKFRLELMFEDEILLKKYEVKMNELDEDSDFYYFYYWLQEIKDTELKRKNKQLFLSIVKPLVNYLYISEWDKQKKEVVYHLNLNKKNRNFIDWLLSYERHWIKKIQRFYWKNNDENKKFFENIMKDAEATSRMEWRMGVADLSELTGFIREIEFICFMIQNKVLDFD
jgi:hypothetical protein